jgi:hypothetical protein
MIWRVVSSSWRASVFLDGFRATVYLPMRAGVHFDFYVFPTPTEMDMVCQQFLALSTSDFDLHLSTS